MDWFDKAKELHQQGLGYKRIGKQLNMSPKTVESRFLREKAKGNIIEPNKTVDLQASILKELQNGISTKTACEKYKQSERIILATIEDIRDLGYQIVNDGDKLKLCNLVLPQDNRITSNWKGEKIIRFGLYGDTQFNSKYCQITHLHNYFDILKSEGIPVAYHTGDIDEGEEMRAGHKYECYSQGADDHVKEIVKTHPKGTEICFISGNHDHSIIKRCGYDIGYAIQSQRPDMKYLGQNCATIELTPNCTLELRHPGDGTAYAYSYKPQKIVEAIQGGDKPKIMGIGHYHKAEYLPENRNVHTFQTGCFQAQTPWMKSKGIAAHVGGWIVEIHVDDEGTVTRCKGEFIPYYKMIRDDYLNYK
jgi:hypothetical protein